NGLWRQADATMVHFSSKFSGVEANIRWFSVADGPFEGIFGVRFFNHQEELEHITADDLFNDIANSTTVITQSPPNPPNPVILGTARRLGDPRVTATYGTRVNNRIVGPQLGFEGHILPVNWLALTYTAKAMLGVNFLDREVMLVRGDGLVGFDTHE